MKKRQVRWLNGLLLLFPVVGLLSACMHTSCDKPYRGNLNTFSLLPPARCISPDCLKVADTKAKTFFSGLPVQVFRVGHSRLISFPSDSLFQGRSSNFSRCAFRMLDAVAAYLKQDDIAVLEVDAYTDNTGSTHRDRLITEQRAGKIVRYLTEKNVPINLMYAVGWGQKAALSPNLTARGQQLNRRIELRYRVIQSEKNKRSAAAQRTHVVTRYLHPTL